MADRRVLISGASIAGLSAAFWLARTGWDVTVIERASAFREGGQNVDVRGVAREVLTRMGLFDEVKAKNTTETGTVLVDDDGDVIVRFPDDDDGATAELEILRGDLARTILEHLPDRVRMVYGDTIRTVTDDGERVIVTTAAGNSIAAELLVIAEGVRSSTRDTVFGDLVERNELDINMVFGTIPRSASDDRQWRWYNTTGGRQAHLRPDDQGTTRAILAYARGTDLTRLDRDAALAAVAATYADAGWETPRIVEAFRVADDVYVDYLTQVKMPTWHRGRVCVTGDAAWCVTPLGGGGSSLALTSGYVLAAFLSSSDRMDSALRSSEEWMRPMVDAVQTLPPAIHALAYPQTRVGLAIRNTVNRALTSKLLTPLAKRLTRIADTDRELPALLE